MKSFFFFVTFSSYIFRARILRSFFLFVVVYADFTVLFLEFFFAIYLEFQLNFIIIIQKFPLI